MCAGITMYDPLKKRGATKGTRVGIVGLGGLGVMGVKLAVALGCEVTVISRAESKRALAQNCGASHFLIHTDSQEMLEHAKSLDLILNTVPVFHDYLKFQTLLDGKNARQVILGLHKGLIAGFLTHAVTCGMSRVMASGIGGIKNTQEVIDLCHQNNIYPEVEVFSAERLNEKFGTSAKFQMTYGSLSLFYGGLESLLGPPKMYKGLQHEEKTLFNSMEFEHCGEKDASEMFTAPNGVTTTSETEWVVVCRPDADADYPERTGYRAHHPEWCRNVRPLSEMVQAMENECNAKLRSSGHSEVRLH